MARAGGPAAAMVETDVISIGLNLTGQAFKSAGVVSNPASLCWLVKSTKSIEFFFTMPIRSISPIMLYILSDRLNIHSAMRAPDMLNGSANKTENG